MPRIGDIAPRNRNRSKEESLNYTGNFSILDVFKKHIEFSIRVHAIFSAGTFLLLSRITGRINSINLIDLLSALLYFHHASALIDDLS